MAALAAVQRRRQSREEARAPKDTTAAAGHARSRRKRASCSAATPAVVPCAVREGMATPGFGEDAEGDVSELVTGRELIAESAVAGAVAGGLVELTLYPLDTVKTRLMAATCAPGGFAGPLWAGLYAGAGTSTVGAVLQTGCFFGTYEPLRRWMQAQLPEELSSVAQFASAAAASVVSTLLRQPAEVVKQQMQTSVGIGVGAMGAASSSVSVSSAAVAASASSPMVVSQSLTGACRSVLSATGIRGFYAGLLPVLLRDVPFNAVEFTVYEQMKYTYLRLRGIERRTLTPTEAATLGGAAGMATGGITTPLDVIKTRLMMQSSKEGVKRTFTGTAKYIVRNEGWQALFAGLGPRLLWIGLGGVLFFGLLEQTEALLAQRREARREERRRKRREAREEAARRAAAEGATHA